jgi:EF-P beta-lysylation protein EpmB
MITRTNPTWQQALRDAFTDPEELVDYLGLDRSLIPPATAASRQFRLLVPRGFADLMARGNPDDPLLRQVLPLAAELEEQPGFLTDPVGDGAATAAPGLLHKYRGRALLIATGACGIHCRYCFRRHFPYAESRMQGDAWQKALLYLEQESSIEEVILSGGDPLMIRDPLLGSLIDDLAGISHLRRLRIHSRLPLVLPQRVTHSLSTTLSGSRLQPVLVLHCNHPRELSQDVVAALDSLRRAGITLLNQSVLLRGVNDSADTLVELSRALFAVGVLPYYLHALDPVQGAAHFSVADEEAGGILRDMMELLPGYLVPRLVREQRGAAAKQPIPPCSS